MSRVRFRDVKRRRYGDGKDIISPYYIWWNGR